MLNDVGVETVGNNTNESMMDIETRSNDDLLDISDEDITDSSDNIRINNNSNNDDDDGVDLVSRATSTASNVAMDTQQSDSWTPLQLCYGIPLFDEDVNADVTRKVFISLFCIFFRRSLWTLRI